MAKKILISAAIVIFIVLNSLILKNELILKNGKEVMLKLAPVDPRSLLQGDFMALNYEITSELQYMDTKEYSSGKVILDVDPNRVGWVKEKYTNQKLSSTEVLLKYKKKGGEIRVATNGYFFQEGTAGSYENAEYGLFKVGKGGNAILIGLMDKNFNRCKP